MVPRPSVDPTSGRSPTNRFDAQAARFDRRAGVPPAAAHQIAAAVLDGVGHSSAEKVVLELGAGTGEVGRHLAVLADIYAGVDLSAPMLAVFRAKLTSTPTPSQALLLRADGDKDWPVRHGSVAVVFASRVAHLLGAAHVVGEAARVCRKDGRFVIGRIERSGVKQVLRRQREAILADHGVAGARSGGRRTQALLEAFAAAGALVERKRRVATWTVTTTAEEVIAGWETMPSMGGEAVAPQVRVEVLSELRRWAEGEFGDLDRPQESEETYTLEGVRLG